MTIHQKESKYSVLQQISRNVSIIDLYQVILENNLTGNIYFSRIDNYLCFLWMWSVSLK